MTKTRPFAGIFISLNLLLSVNAHGTAGPHSFILAPGQTTEFPLVQDQIAEARIPLKSYEYLSFKVIPAKTALELKVTDPDGHTVKQLTPFDRETEVGFANDRAGDYVIRISGSRRVAGRGDGTVRITEFHHWNATERLNGDPVAKPEASMVVQLRENLKRDKAKALREFWADVEKRGTPLIDDLEGDAFNKRATFVWRGDDETRNVLVMMWPFSLASQGAYQMNRIEGTNVWFLSIPLPKDLRCLYEIAVNVPEAWKAGATDVISAAEQVDPLNHRSVIRDPHYPDRSRFETASVIVMPDAPEQKWTEEQKGVPRGTVKEDSIPSGKLGQPEPVSVYLPPGHSAGDAPQSVFILFDRLEYTTLIPTPTILDNLISEKKIPPTVAVLIEFPEPQDDNRSIQLTCNPIFTEFLKLELLPWLQKKYGVKTDPRHLIIGGSSFGGLAATCAGLHHPDTFQNILSQSGSYWWTKEFNRHRFDKAAAPDDPDRELADVMKMVLARPKLPLRFYMEAGSREIDLGGKSRDLLTSGRHLRDVLLAKGYDVAWHQFRGGHDYLSWRGSLAEGLIHLQNARRK